MEILNAASLSQKVVVITGGEGILGTHIREGFVANGSKVVVLDLHEPKNTDESGYTFIACDLGSEQSICAAIAEIVQRFGTIDVLINNAASKSDSLEKFFAPFEDYSLDTWRQVMSVNIDAMFLLSREVARIMKKQGSGSIIQTSSIYGVVGANKKIYEGSFYLGGQINTPAVYSASKAAVIGLTRWMATYLGEDGIRVNCVVPGGVSSGQNKVFEDNYSEKVPLARMANAEEMVSAFLYLASESSSYVNGHVLHVDGGFTAW